MTKIDIYSGFLGAGKTTLIKKMIQEAYCGQQLVLIENEFGEIGIDGGFLKDAGINITEMNSGCICCSLVGDFGKALEEVISTYHPDRVIIEPSGVGKLSDVISAVKKVTDEDVVLGYTVAVADAGKVKMYMKNFGEFYNNQIETAGTIILSRTDSIPQQKLDTAVQMMKEHNPNATIVTTPWGELTGQQLLEAMAGQATLAAELAKLQQEQEEHHHHHHEEEHHCCGGHGHHHDHEEGHHCCGHHHGAGQQALDAGGVDQRLFGLLGAVLQHPETGAGGEQQRLCVDAQSAQQHQHTGHDALGVPIGLFMGAKIIAIGQILIGVQLEHMHGFDNSQSIKDKKCGGCCNIK